MRLGQYPRSRSVGNHILGSFGENPHRHSLPKDSTKYIFVQMKLGREGLVGHIAIQRHILCDVETRNCLETDVVVVLNSTLAGIILRCADENIVNTVTNLQLRCGIEIPWAEG